MTQPELRALQNAQPATRYVAPGGEVLTIAPDTLVFCECCKAHRPARECVVEVAQGCEKFYCASRGTKQRWANEAQVPEPATKGGL